MIKMSALKPNVSRFPFIFFNLAKIGFLAFILTRFQLLKSRLRNCKIRTLDWTKEHAITEFYIFEHLREIEYRCYLLVFATAD